MEKAGTSESSGKWARVADRGVPIEGGRFHAKVDGRFVSIFRHKGKLHCIDSICHHAGGPLTLGPLQDIEDLGVTAVVCPWHKFLVSIDGGVKAYQGVEFKGGKPVNAGWKLGKIVQRPHRIAERPSGVYISLHLTTDPCTSDNDAYSELCAQDYEIHANVIGQLTDEELLATN
mmetsp:Transcript_11681/g.19555  ORF Transcript_11681/g.19555 Transcript_11681/m.19555 type:complete len:174 (-) Transcript_11681:1322-1843(-)